MDVVIPAEKERQLRSMALKGTKRVRLAPRGSGPGGNPLRPLLVYKLRDLDGRPAEILSGRTSLAAAADRQFDLFKVDWLKKRAAAAAQARANSRNESPEAATAGRREVPFGRGFTLSAPLAEFLSRVGRVHVDARLARGMPPSRAISLPCRQQVAGVRAGAVEPEPATATATAIGRERVMVITTLNPRFGDAPPSPPAGNGSDLLRIWTSGSAPSPRRYPARADAASASSPVRPPSPQTAATATAAAAAPVAAAATGAAGFGTTCGPVLVLVTALVIAGATTTAAAAADIAAAAAVIAAAGAVVVVAAVVLYLHVDKDLVRTLDACASIFLPASCSSGASTPVEDVMAMEVETPLASPPASSRWTGLSPMEVSPSDCSAVRSPLRLRVLTPMDVDT